VKKFASSILLFWIVAVLLGLIFGLHGNGIDLNAILAIPSAQHWFGADDLGRDILARILKGVQVSFFVAVLVTIITMRRICWLAGWFLWRKNRHFFDESYRYFPRFPRYFIGDSIRRRAWAWYR
jgi:MFS superfamily sulfate permease-like transporter